MSLRPKKHPPLSKKEVNKTTTQPKNLKEKQESGTSAPLFKHYSFSAN